MRYWWVNHKQTHSHEVGGGYLWSPKRRSDGHRNPFYEFMREVAPGDRVFSFAGAQIRAIGTITSYAIDMPKPTEFGTVGTNWADAGWRVEVQFTALDQPLRPADHMARLGPLRPPRYAPLLEDGRGAQHAYLAEVSPEFAFALADLIGEQAHGLLKPSPVVFVESTTVEQARQQREAQQLAQIETDPSLPETTRQAVIQARRGQGLFKQRVTEIETHCRLTGVTQVEHLRASHCKPWRDAGHSERLDGENGLLLTPNADHLFDRGFISFDDEGRVLTSRVLNLDLDVLPRLGIHLDKPIASAPFTAKQRVYMAYHRENVFLRAQIKAERKRRVLSSR